MHCYHAILTQWTETLDHSFTHSVLSLNSPRHKPFSFIYLFFSLFYSFTCPFLSLFSHLFLFLIPSSLLPSSHFTDSVPCMSFTFPSLSLAFPPRYLLVSPHCLSLLHSSSSCHPHSVVSLSCFLSLSLIFSVLFNFCGPLKRPPVCLFMQQSPFLYFCDC